jgi:hypothetical protein
MIIKFEATVQTMTVVTRWPSSNNAEQRRAKTAVSQPSCTPQILNLDIQHFNGSPALLCLADSCTPLDIDLRQSGPRPVPATQIILLAVPHDGLHIQDTHLIDDAPKRKGGT